MITFNGILRAENIDPTTVLLVRHHDARAKSNEHTPCSLWHHDLEAFELYQRIQSRNFPIGSSLASFVATPSRETLFTGLHTVVERGVALPGTIDPVSGEDVEGQYLYTLERDERLDCYSGHLLVDWGLGFRAWVQKARHQDKPVVEIRPSPDLGAIAAFAEKFDARGFQCGEWGGGPNADGVVQMQFFKWSDELQAFVEAAYAAHWVLDDEFYWVRWNGGEEARRLFDKPDQIEQANAWQLAKMLTVLIRADRFSEGTLNNAFELGVVPRILRRAAVLAGSADASTPDPIEEANTMPTETAATEPRITTPLADKLVTERDAHQVVRSTPRTASNMLDVEAVCREIYAETRSRYAELKPELGSAALGFRVLYGPPVVNAPYMFLGFQPGGWQDESHEGQHEGWPDQSWYANAQSPLARKIRRVFGIETVEHTGLNMIFFRAPNMKAWNSVPSELKSKLEQFSLERVQRIIEVSRPQHLVVIGLGTFRQLTKTKGRTALLGQHGNCLAVEGEFGGCRATGIVHLSGALVSNKDLDRLKGFFN